MPKGLNLYETVTMLEAIKLRKEPNTFMRDTFFPKSKFFQTEKAIVDIVKGGQKRAPFVAPRINGTIMQHKGYETAEIITPRLAPFTVLTGEDLEKRRPGEDIYTTKSPQQVAADILAEDLTELTNSIIRSEEWFATQVMLGKSFDIELVDEKGVKAGTFNVDYGFTNSITLKAAEKWSSEAVDPIEQIESWIQDYIQANSSSTPTTIVMDPYAAKAFMKNANVKEVLKLRAASGNHAEPRYNGKGVVFYGVFTAYNLEVYSYSNLIQNEDKSALQLLPKGTVIIGCSGEGSMNYGVVRQKEKGVWTKYTEKRVPKYTTNDDEEVDKLRVTSRPLPSQPDIDSWVVATVL